MATGSRTLTLKLLADITQFNDNLTKGNKSVQTLSDQVGDFSKKAALAFAAIGAATIAYAKQAVEAAAADEAAQIKLAATIDASTNASKAQIAEVEKYITKTSIAIGVTDDELRPAFARLVRSTNDVESAQKLLNLALDLQAATGKPLETVTNALGKAYDGNTTALGKLGLGIDSSILKSGDFNKIAAELDKTWGNFAEDTAGSTQKGLERVKIALDEANESIGAALLPVVQDLTAWIMEHFVPALQAMIGGLTGDKSLKKSLGDTYTEFYDWGERIRSIINIIIRLKDEILIVAGVMATMFVASKISAGVAATITAINLLIKTYNALKASAFVAGVAAAFALNPLLGVAAGAAGTAALIAATKWVNGLGGGDEISTASLSTGSGGGGGSGISVPSLGAIPTVSGGGGSGGTTGGVSGGVAGSLNLAEQTNKLLAASVAASNNGASINTSTGVLNKLGAMDGVPQVVVNVSGAIDPESTARTIVNTLNNSFYRGTGGAGGLVDLG